MAEIASAFVSIVPSMQGFGGQLRTGVTASTSSVGRSAGATFGKLFAAAAALGIGAAVGGYLKDAIGQASDLAESANKIDAIFGSAAKNIEDFAAQGAQKLGQTKLEVLNAAATFGTFGKAAGLSGVELSRFAGSFTSLSTDLASFYNTSPEQAVQAIGAALRGEAEPIRQYGVLLDDATLKQEALALGLIKTTTQALTPQQKVLAAQQAILKQTSDAQGDFQRTSGGLANQQRILSASLSDIKTQIGTALLPVATQFFTFLNASGIPAIQSAAASISGFLGPAFDRIGEFFNGSGGQGLSTFVAAIQANLLPVLQTMATTFQTVILPTIQQFATYLQGQLGPVFQQVAGIVTSQVLPILSSLAQFFYGRLYPALIATVAAVAVKLRPAFEAVVQYVQTAVMPAVSALLDLFRKYQPQIETVVLAIVKVTGKVVEFAAQIVSFVLPKALKFQSFLLGALVPAIAAVIGALVKIGTAVIAAGQKFVDAVKFVSSFQKGVLNTIGDVLSFLAKVPGKIIDALGDLGSLLLSAGADLMRGLAQGIANAAGSVIATIKSQITDRLPGFVKDALGIASPSKVFADIGQWIPEGLAKGIRDRASAPIDALKAMLDEAKSFASSVAGSFTPDLFSAASASDFISQGFGSFANLNAVRAALKKLKGYGLDSGFLARLVASGNSALILDLAEGGRRQAQLASTLEGATSRLSSQIGREAATVQFSDDINRLGDRVERALDRAARDIAKGVNGAAANGRRRATA